MNHESALTIVEAVGIYGLCLGTNIDNWPEYVAARKVLDDPIVLRPLSVHSNLKVAKGLQAWERELLLPHMVRLLDTWLAANGGVR